ncbi:NAD(P)H-dependent oxidoreductase [Sphingobacterium phlebotomi]|uniref:NAD(P)H-dependent oxidoreductase n=1 Tax=Sphingobacterium phlebotomi TaxID=2605433 RepID=A0A5D4GVU4_9SPHI|nr:nitroreductase family protein [Sphingobacterium phlebotomi]TYR32991.1 NAD(P)H-dependent oxidoreductase [Sphingobacterium phlebotomi]
MHFLDIAKNRYSTKQYNPNEKISEDIVQQLTHILRLSPSSINSQPWKFTIISDTKTKSALAKVSYHNLEKIKQASHLVVFNVIDNVEKFENEHLSQLPETAANFYNQRVKSLGEAGIKNWMQHQVYLSLGFFLAACASMEIDSTPMEGIQQEEYNKILKYDGYTALFAVVIGHRDVADFNQPTLKPKFRRPLEEVVERI